jgi:hypothetical protein
MRAQECTLFLFVATGISTVSDDVRNRSARAAFPDEGTAISRNIPCHIYCDC